MSEKTFGPDDSWFYRPTMDVGDDYPKWIEPHHQHVAFDERSGRRIAPAFSSFFETHEGTFLVLVRTEDEEKLALAPKTKPRAKKNETAKEDE